MRHITRALMLIAALTAAGTAKAEAVYTDLLSDGSDGDPVSLLGYTLDHLHGRSTLAFSDALLEALDITGTTLSARNEMTVSTDTDAGTIASTTVFGITPIVDSDVMKVSVVNLRTFGGILLTTPGTLPNGQQNAASTGGSLQISGLRVRLDDRAIYANVVGANGVGSWTSVKLWHFANVEGDTVLPLVEGTAKLDMRMSGLTFTQASSDLFKQALGLTGPQGVFFGPLAEFDAGTFSLTAAVDITGPVPEPATFALMGLGLVGLGLATRRTRYSA